MHTTPSRLNVCSSYCAFAESYKLQGQKSSHCCCALLRSATGQGLGNFKLHEGHDAIYEGVYRWRKLQTELLLCFAVVNLFAGIILLFGHLWDGILWKAFLQG